MKQTDYFSVKLENEKIIFLDQTKLPLEEFYITTDNYERIAEAIERLEIRGAPLIGIAAAYGVALSLKNIHSEQDKVFNLSYNRLAQTRPTAVNLFQALDDLKEEFEKLPDKQMLMNFFFPRRKRYVERMKNIVLR